MDRLERQVRRELRRFGPDGGDMTAIVRVWPAAVGETVARNAWPARLARDGTLHVHAASSTWAFELANLAATILAALGRELGGAAPPALRFAPGPLPEPGSEPPERRRLAPPSIGPEHRAEAARLTAQIEDDELRELVARAAAASLAKAPEQPRSDRRF
jgi:hypothetical protein